MPSLSAQVSRWVLASACVAIALACALPGCGSDAPEAAQTSDAGGGLNPNNGGGGACGTPQEGCPCPTEGDKIDCGRVELHSGDQTLCSIGSRVCTDGKWGACTGTNKIVSSLGPVPPGTPGVHTQVLGASMACGAADACDPYCNVFSDDPVGITLPPGLTIGPGGITVVGAGQAVACKSPSDWKAAYGAESGNNRSNGALPTSCTATNCGQDMKCVAGSCVPSAVGDQGVCVGADFTIGSPCWDGARWNLQVCNRGTTSMTSGTLKISHHTGIANADPSTCASLNSGAAGDCSIDLAAKNLKPGECTSFIPTIDCPLSVPDEVGDHYYVVNTSNGPGAALAECNTCNNFAATTDAAKTLPGAACGSVSCGGATSTPSQPATVSGSPTGANTCAGAQDAFKPSCAAATQYKDCEQDLHCDTVTSTCAWNQKTSYTDGTCTGVNGVDLTVGTGCAQGANYVLPICNRGTVPIPTGKNIKVQVVNQGTFNGWNGGNCATTPLTGAATCSHTLVAPLGAGQCVNVTCGTPPTGQSYAVVNYDNSIAECSGAGGCKNNGAAVKGDGAGCGSCQCLSNTAELTGKILDPAKLRPVYGVTVYVPTTAVGALDGPNVTCDTCTNVFKGLPARASATTDVDGTFRLQGVPAGASFPLVIQLGRFRRQITVAAIPACGTATLPAAQAHLPGTHTKTGDTATDAVAPDMPKVAMIPAHGDALECLLLKMGIADSEFTTPGGGGNFEMYGYKYSSGLTGSAGAPNGNEGLTLTGGAAAGCTTAACKTQRINSMGDADALFANSATLNKYNAVIMPCGDGNLYPSTTMQSNFRSWLDAGGRVFASHHAVEDFIRNPNNATNPNKDVAVWAWTGTPQGTTGWANGSSLDQKDRAGANPPASGSVLNSSIDQSFTHGAALAQWMNATWNTAGGPGSGAPALGTIPLPNYRHDVNGATAQSTAWYSGASTYSGQTNPSQVSMLSFDAPVGVPATSQCGRAVLPFMHVSTGVANWGANPPPTFPSACGTYPNRLTGQELAFEFMMWESMTCLSPATASPVAPQPAPLPDPTPLGDVVITRDYTATCPVGTVVQWGFFEWQTVTPLGTSIQFRAATADTAGAFPTDANDPVTVPVGVATGIPIVAPLWGQDANTVDWHLKNDPPDDPQQSKSLLRVYMTFKANTPAAPVLAGWRQLYDCKPAE